jgi:hypothetical protein
VYVEGGPKSAHGDGLRRFKNGFKQHLMRLNPRLNALDVSPCGSTVDAMRDYAKAAREEKPDCVLALLVDADAPVTADSPAKHLEAKLNAAKVPQSARKNIFLMTQCMESWLVTDTLALEKCFGPKLEAKSLPQNPDIESVPKKRVIAALAAAVRLTPAGRYHKIHHGARILAELRPASVGARSQRHAKSFYEFLRSCIEP